MLNEQQKRNILQKLKPYDPSKVGVFGSYARGKEKESSDLDLLVNLRKRINLFELMSLEDELSAILGVEVDLVTENSVNKHLKPHIQKDIVYILHD